MLLSEFIAEYGDEDREIGNELEKVAALAHQYDRSGKLVVTLTVSKLNSRVQVSVGSKATEPRPDPEIGFFFLGPDGLTKNDPHEMFDRRTGEINPTIHDQEL